MNQTVFERVSGVLVDALCCEPEQVTGAAMISKDLGAERVDMLDIAFRIRRDLGIRCEVNDVFPPLSPEAAPDAVWDFSVQHVVSFVETRLAQ